MSLPSAVRAHLAHFTADNPGSKANLARILMHGKLGGSGKMIILPVDQGFEHGPGRSFSINPQAYDPNYLLQLAVDGGVNAFAGPLGLLECVAEQYAAQVPLILKVNSGNAMVRKECMDQAVTATVDDALRLGCAGIGFTLYPGADSTYAQQEELRELTREAKAKGLAVIVWSYPRGNMSKDGETAIDVIAYGAHMAALMGAHIIKVKLPSAHLEFTEAKKMYEQNKVPVTTLAERVRHVVQSCFAGQRMVIFSGGPLADDADVLAEATAIRDGGGQGSIIGRNCFQRPRDQALKLLNDMYGVFLGK
jgi:class I fructose-bisphosphate aldolase